MYLLAHVNMRGLSQQSIVYTCRCRYRQEPNNSIYIYNDIIMPQYNGQKPAASIVAYFTCCSHDHTGVRMSTNSKHAHFRASIRTTLFSSIVPEGEICLLSSCRSGHVTLHSESTSVSLNN